MVGRGEQFHLQKHNYASLVYLPVYTCAISVLKIILVFIAVLVLIHNFSFIFSYTKSVRLLQNDV